MSEETKRFMSRAEVARYAGVSHATVTEWIANRHFDVIRVPGRGKSEIIRVDRGSFFEWWNGNRDSVRCRQKRKRLTLAERLT